MISMPAMPSARASQRSLLIFSRKSGIASSDANSGERKNIAVASATGMRPIAAIINTAPITGKVPRMICRWGFGVPSAAAQSPRRMVTSMMARNSTERPHTVCMMPMSSAIRRSHTSLNANRMLAATIMPMAAASVARGGWAAIISFRWRAAQASQPVEA